MHGLSRLQLIGPLVLFGTVAVADIIAYELANTPSSEWLWFLTHEVFSIFRKSRAVFTSYVTLPFVHLFVAALLAALAVAGLLLRKNFLLAASSNLSLVCAAILVYSSLYWKSMGQVRAASMAAVHVPTGSDAYFVVLLAVGCLVSFAASHYVYFRLLRQRAQ
jgi:NADH:ubiquinone oxidoreductase subunit K